MNEAHELAMIVCRQCVRNQNENDIDFSTRLYYTYTSCKENIEELEKNERSSTNDSVDTYLRQF